MAFNGIALGGAQQGFMDAQNLALNQQKTDQSFELGQRALQLQQQSQDNAQHRQLLAQADKARTELMGVATETIQQIMQNGGDINKASKAVQPLVQQAKRLAKSSGLDDSMIDAQIAATLARPGFNPKDILGGTGASGTSAGQTTAAPSTDQNAGTATAPAQQTTDNMQIGPTNDVDRWTQALVALPTTANSNVKQAVTMRLQEAIRQQEKNDTIEIKTIKDENQNEHILAVDKKNKTAIDVTTGKPYVTPTGEGGDAKAISDAIQSGKQPPVLTGLYKNAKAVRADLARSGFDLTQASLEWSAAQKQIQSLNGPQMVRYSGLAKSVVNTIDEVKDLSKQLKLGGVPIANAAELQTFVQTQGNTEKGQLVTRYLAAVGTLKEEFANLANGGYAPTEPAWALANQQVNGNYGVQQLDASLTEIQRLIRYRLNAIPNFNTLGPGGNNRYTPQGGGQGHAPAGGNDGWSIQRVQ